MGSKKRALGKGLSALLENNASDEKAMPQESNGGVVNSIAEIKIADIETNPYQPRTHFEEEALNELSESIKVHGVIQPIAVRKNGNSYQLISGERRFRASQLAGKTKIPAYIRSADDQTMLEMALVENIQREDLDAIEVAVSYKRLMDECSLNQEELAEKVAKKRATVANYLRLLKLPADVQLGIRERKISMGHARAIISIEDSAKQSTIFNRAVEEGLSVRQVEELARNAKVNRGKKTAGSLKKADLSFEQQKHMIDLQRILESKLDVKKDKSGKGKLTIPFTNDDDLTRILDLLNP